MLSEMRYRARDDNRGLYVAQEQEQYDYRQDRAHQQVLEHAADDDRYVVALAVEISEFQSVVLFLELAHLGVEVVADGRGRDVALLRETEYNAVVAVDFGVDLVGVVAYENVGNVAEPDNADAVDFRVKEHKVAESLFRTNLVADAYKIPAAVVVADIARRHRKALSHQNTRHVVERDLAVHISRVRSGFLLL